MEKNTETISENYDISFFKPKTKLATLNRNFTIVLVSIWAVAIFGFQILLKVVEKPTPEPIYNTFTSVWEDVNNGTASQQQSEEFAQATLTVLCKVFITPEERMTLDNAFESTVYSLMNEEDKDEFKNLIKTFKDTSLTDKEYAKTKQLLSKKISKTINIDENSVLSKISPVEVGNTGLDSYTLENIKATPKIMEKYLIHNQSFLTDFIFLGFPFHYFYTSVFLLILFVGLCWIYCFRTDKIMEKLKITEKV